MNEFLTAVQELPYMQLTFLGNTLYDYAVAAAVFVALIAVLKVFQLFVLAKLRRLAEKTHSTLDDALIDIVAHIRPPVYLLVALYSAVFFVSLPEQVAVVVKFIVLVGIIIEAIRAVEKLVEYAIAQYMQRGNKKEQAASESMMQALRLVIRLVLWGTGLLLLLSNMGVNITSLVASLGIGGIAIALAVQNILSDMFSAFSIYLDQPFQVGDYIKVGEDGGTVKKIGLKTTRIKTLRGEEIVISNRELTNSRIQNFKKLKRRRSSFVLGIEYGLPKKKLEKITPMIEKIFDSVEHATLERCYFAEYNASSLDFNVSYFVESASVGVANDVKEAVNYAIYDAFDKEGIGFAYPTQTIFVKK